MIKYINKCGRGEFLLAVEAQWTNIEGIKEIENHLLVINVVIFFFAEKTIDYVKINEQHIMNNRIFEESQSISLQYIN